MKDLALFTLSLGGGFGILVSYILIGLYGVFGVHISYIKSKTFRKFLFLFILLSLISFVYIIIYASVEKKLEEDNRNLLFSGLVCYIFGSCIWSIVVAYIEIKKINSNIQYIPLLITAIGSVLILVSLKDEEKDILLAACSILIIQHCFIDLIIWPRIHRNGQLTKLK